MRPIRLFAVLAAALLLPAAAPASDAQIEAARAAAAPYGELAAAKRAGWRPFGDAAPLMGRHYFHPSNPDYLPGEAVDPARPSNLLYAELGGRQVLVGLAFNWRLGAGDGLPEGFAGARDVFHVHDVARFVAAVTEDRPLLRAAARLFVAPQFDGDDGVRRDRLAMVHVWTIPNPDGPFSSHNRALPFLRLGLPYEWALGTSDEAALGLALATADGCEAEAGVKAWVGNLPRGAKRDLMAACERSAAHVRARLGRREAALRAGEEAWLAYAYERRMLLTPDQKRRIGAIAEPGPGITVPCEFTGG